MEPYTDPLILAQMDESGETLQAVGTMDVETAVQLHVSEADPADAILEAELAFWLLDEIASWRHLVSEDCWYTCAVATEERDGGICCDESRADECDCGVDRTRGRIVAAMAKRFGLAVVGSTASTDRGSE
jgi:hypothetical protein